MTQHLTTFLEIAPQSDFSIHNLPYGIFSETAQGDKRVGVAIGDWVIDLAALETLGLLPNCKTQCFNQSSLNKFIETGDPKNALLPNWSELPVGYNGRASSVVVSGKEIVRPSGQIKLPHEERPLFSATRKLDFELETAFIVGKTTALGEPIAIEDAWDHIFGMVLLNDWSARDIQQWEYVPLGPFNAKTFASAISPWVVTMQALEPFKVKGPQQLPEPLDYLKEHTPNSFDIHLSVELQSSQSQQSEVICQTNFKYMYWSMAQQLTQPQTISATKNPSPYPMVKSGAFLEMADSNSDDSYAEKGAIRVGFGQVANTILPAKHSAAYRVRIALNLKQLDYVIQPVHLLKNEQQQESYIALNPSQLVPSLIDQDQSFIQSLNILEYLEERYPSLPLLPTDLVERAKVRAFSQTIACDIHPLDNLRVLKYLKHELAVNDEQKNQWTQMVNSGFGTQATFADCCLIPQVYNAKRFNVDLSDFPKIQSIDQHCLSLPAFLRATPEQQPDWE
ncbi:hypothetical protein FQR65_LT18758 [Abscondita terminalis]|nr:hypothetical protein FQR65_LT18758 [Abscondita terminalis]